MSDSQAAPVGRPRVLLAAHTGRRYVVQHYEILERMGCDAYITSFTHTKANLVGGAAFMLRERGPWDLLVHMGLGPGQERLPILKEIQELRAKCPQMHILVVSGHDASYARKEVLDHGGSDYLRRDSPDEPEEFEKKVRALLGDKVAHLKPPR